MGWNKIEQNTIGDEPLDLLSECVERIAQCYQDEVGRSPTSDELLASIMHVLNASGGMVIPDLAERQTFIRASQLRVGEKLRRGSGTRIAVTGARGLNSSAPVFNLEVNVEHTYYVGSAGVLTHNNNLPFNPDQELRLKRTRRWQE